MNFLMYIPTFYNEGKPINTIDRIFICALKQFVSWSSYMTANFILGYCSFAANDGNLTNIIVRGIDFDLSNLNHYIYKVFSKCILPKSRQLYALILP